MYDIIYAGDIIQSGGRTFKVTKVNSANYRCINEAGQQWNVRRTGATKAPAGTPFRTPEAPTLFPGDTVRFRGDVGDKFPGIYVCTKADTAEAHFSKLNGRSRRYVRVHPNQAIPTEVVTN